MEQRLGRKVDNQLADLGRNLFHDTIVGLNNDNSCSGCHSATAGFGDTQSIAIGVDNNFVVGPDRLGPRNQRRTPMAANTAFFPTLFFAFALMGIGGGTSFMPLLHIAMGDVPARDAGLASGIVNVSMWISASLGLAALGAIAADRTKTLAAAGHSATAALTGGYDLAFLIGAGLVAVGVVVAIVVLPAGEREREREPDAEPALG